MSTNYSQDSSHGRLWQQRPLSTAGSRPRVLLFAGAFASGMASHFLYERTWGARATTPNSSTKKHQVEEEPPHAPKTETPQVSPKSPAHAAAYDPDKSPNAAPAQTGAAAVWRGVFDPGSNPVVTRKGVEPGRSYYDTAESVNALSTWQQVLRSEEMRRFNFVDLVWGSYALNSFDIRKALEGPVQ